MRILYIKHANIRKKAREHSFPRSLLRKFNPLPDV